MGLIQHSCTGKCKVWLVDRDTGEQLANNAKKALQMGLIEKSKKPAKEPLEGKLKEEGAEEGKEGKELTEPLVSYEGIFRYTITLPADAFTLFNLAKACGMEKDREKLFCEWLWDCIRKRYETDYKVQLVLAPLEE